LTRAANSAGEKGRAYRHNDESQGHKQQEKHDEVPPILEEIAPQYRVGKAGLPQILFDTQFAIKER
jgi:hypothetical protein